MRVLLISDVRVVVGAIDGHVVLPCPRDSGSGKDGSGESVTKSIRLVMVLQWVWIINADARSRCDRRADVSTAHMRDGYVVAHGRVVRPNSRRVIDGWADVTRPEDSLAAREMVRDLVRVVRRRARPGVPLEDGVGLAAVAEAESLRVVRRLNRAVCTDTRSRRDGRAHMPASHVSNCDMVRQIGIVRPHSGCRIDYRSDMAGTEVPMASRKVCRNLVRVIR